MVRKAILSCDLPVLNTVPVTDTKFSLFFRILRLRMYHGGKHEKALPLHLA